MLSTWKTVLATGVLGCGGLLVLGPTPASAQALMPRDASNARATYTPVNPVSPALPAPTLPTARPPAPSVPSPATYAGDPSVRPGPPPYPPPAPPKKRSRLRKAFSFLFLGGSEAGDGSRTVHIDPATGRTDLPGARPWMQTTH